MRADESSGFDRLDTEESTRLQSTFRRRTEGGHDRVVRATLTNAPMPKNQGRCLFGVDLELFELFQLVPQEGCLLEFEVLGRLFHAFLEIGDLIPQG